jgi:hypothetical protein
MIGDGCFPAGTPVAVQTAVGPQQRAIESLQPGETLITASGPMQLRAIEPRESPPAPGAAIRLLPGAFGPGQPGQELLVTSEQLLLIRDAALSDGVLAPAGALVNGRSIQRIARPPELAWFGIALESHGMPLVANLPAAGLRDPDQPLSARLLPPGPGLFALRGRLSRMAAAEAPPPAEPAQAPAPSPAPLAAPAPAEDAPALLLLADGQMVAAHPTAGAGHRWCFTIPPAATALRLRSPVGHPPGEDKDGRAFGVAIQALLLDGIPLDLGGPAAGEGFHMLEIHEQQCWRWTDGNAELVLPPCATPRKLAVIINDWHTMLQRGR